VERGGPGAEVVGRRDAKPDRSARVVVAGAEALERCLERRAVELELVLLRIETRGQVDDRDPATRRTGEQL
jgi:hypothetical protein